MAYTYNYNYIYYLTFTIQSVDLIGSFEPHFHSSDEIRIRFGEEEQLIRQTMPKKVKKPVEEPEKKALFQAVRYSGQSEFDPGSSADTSARSTELRQQRIEELISEFLATKEDPPPEEIDESTFTAPVPFGVKKWEVFSSPNRMVDRFQRYFINYDLYRNDEMIAKASLWMPVHFINLLKQPNFKEKEEDFELELYYPARQIIAGKIRVIVKVEQSDEDVEKHMKENDEEKKSSPNTIA